MSSQCGLIHLKTGGDLAKFFNEVWLQPCGRMFNTVNAMLHRVVTVLGCIFSACHPQ